AHATRVPGAGRRARQPRQGQGHDRDLPERPHVRDGRGAPAGAGRGRDGARGRGEVVPGLPADRPDARQPDRRLHRHLRALQRPAEQPLAMYEAYWELAEPPFDNSPNPKFFYLSPEHEEALVRLVYTVRHRKGCGMLTGEYGCGKTTLSRALIQRLEADRYEIGLLTNPSWTPVEFLREVLYQLGVETDEKNKSELLHLLNDAFYRNFQAGRDSVVIVDEAQLIDDDAVFEELRLLLNFQTDELFLVTLLLIGSPELAVKVRRMKHLDQRI